MPVTPSLDQLGIHHNTDKSSRSHNYLRAYEHFLRPFKDEPINLVEIGIFNGDSARVWLEYFSQATVHCIDIDPARAQSIVHSRYVGHTMDQGDLKKMSNLISQINPMILIDDGSHFWEHQALTLIYLGFLVNDQGVVIVEDLEVNYPPLADTYSRGFCQRPVDLIMQMASGVLSGGLDQSINGPSSISKSKNIYSSITCIEHSLVACRSNYYSAKY